MKRVQVISLLLLASQISFADENIFDKNLDYEAAKTEFKNLQSDRKINRSTFYPKLNIVTGIGSEYTRDKTETEKGGMLYLDSKINLYNGFKDYNLLSKNRNQLNKANAQKEMTLIKIKNDVYKKFQEINTIQEQNNLIKTELENNKNQSNWALKKVNAGLTSNAELMDFQIKQTNLENEISINELKLKELENELKQLFNSEKSADLTLEDAKKVYSVLTDKLTMKNPSENSLTQKVLIADLKIAEDELKASKSGYYPSLDLEAKAGTITPSHSLLKDKTEHQIALTLTIPIFSGFETKAESQKALNEKTQKEKELRSYQVNLNSNIELDKKRIELNKLLLKGQEEMLAKSIKFYDQTINEYKRGIKNSSELISASDRVLETRKKILELKAEINSRILDFNNAYVD